jgi:hypothetical protein
VEGSVSNDSAFIAIQCIKCGSVDCVVNYNAGGVTSFDCHSYSSRIARHTRYDEHLDYRCTRCHYEWEGDTKDKQTKQLIVEKGVDVVISQKLPPLEGYKYMVDANTFLTNALADIATVLREFAIEVPQDRDAYAGVIRQALTDCWKKYREQA